jgi:hypothetical protein
MLVDTSRVIQNDRVLFAGECPDHPASHLPEEADALGGPRQYAARYVRLIPTFGQHHAVGDKFKIAFGEAGLRLVVILGGLHASLTEKEPLQLAPSVWVS